MDTKKFLMGTIVGGIAYFFLGFVFYALLLAEFFANNGGGAENVAKTEMQWWPLILGNLALGAFYSYIFLKWANIKTFGAGLQAAGVLGFLMAFSYDMIMYDTSNFMNLTATLTDVVVFTVMSAIGGGIIGITVGMGEKPAAS